MKLRATLDALPDNFCFFGFFFFFVIFYFSLASAKKIKDVEMVVKYTTVIEKIQTGII